MSESNEVPTYQPPVGVNGPTLGRDLPDGCERCLAHADPREADHWLAWHDGARVADLIYWWRPRQLKVTDRVQLTGTVTDRVQLTGTVTEVRPTGFYVAVDDDGDRGTRWFPYAALTRVVDQ